jgi:hypothetical protein
MNLRACVDSDPALRAAFGKLLQTVQGFSPEAHRGLTLLEQAAQGSRAEGLYGFALWFTNPSVGKELSKLCHIVGSLEDVLPPPTLQRMIKELSTRYEQPSCKGARGVVYALRQIHAEQLAARAISHRQIAMNGRKVVYLLEKPDPEFHRRVDIVAIVVDASQRLDDPNIASRGVEAIRVESKWYRSRTVFDVVSNREEVLKDMMRAYQAHGDFRSLYYAFPADYTVNALERAGDTLFLVFRELVEPTLRGRKYGLNKGEVDSLFQDFTSHLQGGMIQLITDEVPGY